MKTRFLDLLRAAQEGSRSGVLIASLPRNDPELARAALAGGADVLKVHLNVTHNASGVRFGSLAEEAANLEAILRAAGEVPVGIVPSGNADLKKDELEKLDGMGFDFLSLYDSHAPVGSLPGRDRLSRMIALSSEDDRFLAARFPRLAIDIVELSVMDHQTYGEPFTYRDLAKISDLIAAVAPLPSVLPTQRRITPEMVPELIGAGVCGLMIGVIVAGRTPESWKAACGAYRRALAGSASS